MFVFQLTCLPRNDATAPNEQHGKRRHAFVNLGRDIVTVNIYQKNKGKEVSARFRQSKYWLCKMSTAPSRVKKEIVNSGRILTTWWRYNYNNGDAGFALDVPNGFTLTD